MVLPGLELFARLDVSVSNFLMTLEAEMEVSSTPDSTGESWRGEELPSVAQLVYIPPHSTSLTFSTFVWLSWRVKVSTFAAASAVISSILDLRGFGATGGGSFFIAGSASTSFLATGSESAAFLVVGATFFLGGTLGLAPGGFFRLADRLMLAIGGAGLVGLALMDAVRLTTDDGRAGSLSAGLRTRWTAGFRRFSESVERFLSRGDGDLLRAFRARLLLCLPCLLSGEGLREG